MRALCWYVTWTKMDIGRKYTSDKSIIVEFPFNRLVNEMCDRHLTLISPATQRQSYFRQIIHLCQIFVGDKPFIAAQKAIDGVVFACSFDSIQMVYSQLISDWIKSEWTGRHFVEDKCLLLFSDSIKVTLSLSLSQYHFIILRENTAMENVWFSLISSHLFSLIWFKRFQLDPPFLPKDNWIASGLHWILAEEKNSQNKFLSFFSTKSV